jgi:hypothetical protein
MKMGKYISTEYIKKKPRDNKKLQNKEGKDLKRKKKKKK